MLTPYSPLPALSIQSDLFLRVMAKELKTGTAICSSTAILSYRNVSLYRDCSLSDEIRSRIQSQQQYEYDPEKPIYCLLYTSNADPQTGRLVHHSSGGRQHL